MTQTQYAHGRGTLLSLVSSVAFGALFLLTPLAEPVPALVIASFRMFTGVLALLLILRMLRMRSQIIEVWQLMRSSWLRTLNVIVCGLILVSQLWLFAWAPMSGRAIQVSLGYFLLPLVLVLVGRFLYKDRLHWWHWAAVALAAVGVTLQIFVAGELSWEALWISITYSLYFVLRRYNGHDNLGGMFFEQLMMTPIALAVLIWLGTTGDSLIAPVGSWLAALLIASIGTLALVLWVAASRLLPISLFGLLSYIEPCLLTVAALLIGERITAHELPPYIAIWAAIAFVIGGGIYQAKQRRVSYDAPVAPPTGSIPIIMDPDHDFDEFQDAEHPDINVFTGSIALPNLDSTDENPDTRDLDTR